MKLLARIRRAFPLTTLTVAERVAVNRAAPTDWPKPTIARPGDYDRPTWERRELPHPLRMREHAELPAFLRRQAQ